MTIHILDCATMLPWFARLPGLTSLRVGTTCLVVETDHGLTLVDTGIGLHDYQRPSLLVRFLRADIGIIDNPEKSAVRQLARMGYAARDVTDIILTHLHFDHAGGLPDFPHARVHVHSCAYETIQHRSLFFDWAFDRQDFSHNPQWVLYDHPTESWLGFEANRLPLTPQTYLIPLFGHAPGHCGVAVQDGDGWILMCGDAVPINLHYDQRPQWLVERFHGPHIPRLRDFSCQHPEVRVIAGHMQIAFFNNH